MTRYCETDARKFDNPSIIKLYVKTSHRYSFIIICNSAACQTLGRVGNAVQDVTGTMTSSRISGLQDNEARESHYLAVQTLKKAEEVN